MNNESLLHHTECKKCGKHIYGRTDKQFCDAYCRNAFNNNIKRTEEKEIIAVNSKLRKNRRILKTLSPVGKSTVRKEVMIAMGYDFKLILLML